MVAMRIAKPLLLITTPIGVALGLYEAWRLAGRMVFLMAALLVVIGVRDGLGRDDRAQGAQAGGRRAEAQSTRRTRGAYIAPVAV